MPQHSFLPCLFSCERKDRAVGDISAPHEPAAAELGKFGETERFVKGYCFGRVVRCQQELPDIGIAVKHCLEQRRADALPLLLRGDQNVLHENNGGAVADDPDESDQLAALIRRQNEQRILKAALQRGQILRIGRPADGGIQSLDLVFLVFFIFFDLRGILTAFVICSAAVKKHGASAGMRRCQRKIIHKNAPDELTFRTKADRM